MSFVLRVLLYTLCLFLVMVVYTGQKHTTAGATVQASLRMTAKLMMWSVVGVLIMFTLEYLFVD